MVVGIVLLVFTQLPMIRSELNIHTPNAVINTINKLDIVNNMTKNPTLQEVAISPNKYKGKEISLRGMLEQSPDSSDDGAAIKNNLGYYVNLNMPGNIGDGNIGFIMRNRILSYKVYTFSGKIKYFKDVLSGHWQLVVNKINGNPIKEYSSTIP